MSFVHVVFPVCSLRLSLILCYLRQGKPLEVLDNVEASIRTRSDFLARVSALTRAFLGFRQQNINLTQTSPVVCQSG